MKLLKKMSSGLISSGIADPAETIRRTLAANGLNNASATLQEDLLAVKRTLLHSGLGTTSTDEGITLPDKPSGEQAAPGPQGSFDNHSYRGLDYKLYIPSGYASLTTRTFPLTVMLHGCTQSPDDFAAGTRMNELAEDHGFLVAYPAQTASANGSRCWNWFRTEDQSRDRGEPSMIAGMTRDVAAHYRIDAHRIFVAGLSAGAAMAVVLGTTYPDLYAGVGVHSGLAYAVAHDASSAFSAMRNGSSAANAGSIARPVPTIVFHGNRDNTVNVKNGSQIVQNAIARSQGQAVLTTTVEEGVSQRGGAFTRTVYSEGPRPHIEHWLLHGSGHAWSGGSSNGSYTDIHGPDASSEMVRFFYSQP